MSLVPLRIVLRHLGEDNLSIILDVHLSVVFKLYLFVIIINVQLSSCIKDCVAYKCVLKTMA